jgi:hypothetical protein
VGRLEGKDQLSVREGLQIFSGWGHQREGSTGMSDSLPQRDEAVGAGGE